MRRLSALVLERDERAVLFELGRLGCLELVRTAADDDLAPLVQHDKAEQLGRCDRLLTRAVELQRVWEPLPAAPASVPESLTLAEAEERQHRLEEHTAELVRRRDALQRRLRDLETSRQQAAPYCGPEVPLDQVQRGDFVHFVAGSLPAGHLERLQLDERVLLVALPIDQGRQPILAVTSRPAAAALEQALQQAGFERADLSALEGATPELVVEDLRREQLRAAQELEQVEGELRTLGAEATVALSEIEAWACRERRVLETQQDFLRTESAVLIRGWLAVDSVSDVSERLQGCTKGRCVLTTEGAEERGGAEVPVLLRHSRLLRPFEMLVAAYGLPRYGELAPTLFVAVSFVLMFGIMFGDLGHGTLLALGGWVGVLAGRSRTHRDMGVLLLFNGLSSAAFGLVYGSAFGIPHLRKFALWRDPLEGDPMMLMLLAVGLGVVLMSVGLWLNIVNRLRVGDWMEGVLGKFGLTGVVFYWGALLLVTQSPALQFQTWFTWACGVCLGVPVVAWAVKEPLALIRARRSGQGAASDGMMSALLESLVGAFEGVLLYLANTVSFVRLAAYAMSHAALLAATFALAAEVKRLAHDSAALGLAVIILGNLVAMVLEGIVAAVQALRLEYYEFFGKFFSGDGRPFKPFSLAASPGWR